MLVIDGSYGEGGGQIVRTALVLSLLTGRSFRIEHIRAGRPKPGLKPQHLHILKTLLQMSDSAAEGVTLGARSLTFHPGRLHAGSYHVDIGTAGAIPLFLQTMIPAGMFADGPVTLRVRGGTEVRGAMTIDFWTLVLLPFLQPYAEQLDLHVEARGYYPAGGGTVVVHIVPRYTQRTWRDHRATAPSLDLRRRGRFKRVGLVSCATTHLRERRVAERQVEGFRGKCSLTPLKEKVHYADSPSPGTSITAAVTYEHTRLGADALGKRGKPAEAVGADAARRLRTVVESNATVDPHTADNLLLWVALFGGSYRISDLTGHVETNAWIINTFLPGALQLPGKSGGWVTGASAPTHA